MRQETALECAMRGRRAGDRTLPQNANGPRLEAVFDDVSKSTYFFSVLCGWSFLKTMFPGNSGFGPGGFDSACGRAACGDCVGVSGMTGSFQPSRLSMCTTGTLTGARA